MSRLLEVQSCLVPTTGLVLLVERLCHSHAPTSLAIKLSDTVLEKEHGLQLISATAETVRELKLRGKEIRMSVCYILFIVSTTVPPLLSNVTFYIRFSSVFNGILPTEYVDVNGTLDHIENTVS